MTSDPSNLLARALARHSVDLPRDQVETLARYCHLLWDWNRKLNLTRHTDYEAFVARDVVDSLQLSSLLHESEEVLDVGSGGGAPGVILCIVRPDLQVSLCDSVGKKARALDAVVRELERNDVDLDRALLLFEQGVRDLREARALLEAAEIKVRKVVEEADGTLGFADADV